MQAAYDLHIHSALSPCGSDDMTPNNIVNMAVLKELDVIAVTDHNCADNAPAVERLAAAAGLICVPGVEMTTAEEVHVLAYFCAAKEARDFGQMLYEALPEIPNNEAYFGPQWIMNEKDEVVGCREKLLVSALPYDFRTCCCLARDHGGVVVPAHVNKGANSVLSNLGFFPDECLFDTIEVCPGLPLDLAPARFRQIFSSDAHDLACISEPERRLELEVYSSLSVLRALTQ